MIPLKTLIYFVCGYGAADIGLWTARLDVQNTNVLSLHSALIYLLVGFAFSIAVAGVFDDENPTT
jgi:hypothetical protein